MDKKIKKKIFIIGAILITFMMVSSYTTIAKENKNQSNGIKLIIANGDIHFSPCPISPIYNHFPIPGIKIGKTIIVDGDLTVNGKSCDSIKTKLFIAWYVIDPYSDTINDWLIGIGI